MTKQDIINQDIARIQASTSQIATNLQALKDEITANDANTISDASLTNLDNAIKVIEALAAPADAIPAPVAPTV